MQKLKKILILSGALALVMFSAGCAAHQQTRSSKAVVRNHPVSDQTGARIAVDLTATAPDNLRTPEVRRTYVVSGLPDPANPRVLNRTIVVDRIEQDAQWVISPPPSRAPTREVAYQPAMLSRELAMELERQRSVTASLEQSTMSLAVQASRLETMMELLMAATLEGDQGGPATDALNRLLNP
jgi:hypothetical protein